MARMTATLKDLQQKVRLLKIAKRRRSGTMPPLWATKIGPSQREGWQWEGKPTPVLNTGRCQCPPRARKGKTFGDPQAILSGSPISSRTSWQAIP